MRVGRLIALSPATLERVNWLWLSGPAVLLFMLVMAVLNVPTTLADNWQRAQSALRWWRERRYRKPEWTEVTAGRMTSSTDLDALRAAYGTFPAADTVLSLVPGVYSNASGAATTIGSGLGMPIAPVR